MGKTGLNPVFIYPEFVVKIVRTVVVRFQAVKIMPFSFNIYGEKGYRKEYIFRIIIVIFRIRSNIHTVWFSIWGCTYLNYIHKRFEAVDYYLTCRCSTFASQYINTLKVK